MGVDADITSLVEVISKSSLLRASQVLFAHLLCTVLQSYSGSSVIASWDLVDFYLEFHHLDFGLNETQVEMKEVTAGADSSNC